ncbi:heme exporter protein CcmD [Azospira restricta]|uniref:heme exporter protein CcmD n=1 Tax=Azospira restricta TaxID=404405 RepID=UPI003610FF2E
MNIHWQSFSDFLATGGYGLYVWGSFGVTALILALEPMLAVRRRNQLIARLKRQLRAETKSAGERRTPPTPNHPQ